MGIKTDEEGILFHGGQLPSPGIYRFDPNPEGLPLDFPDLSSALQMKLKK